MHNIVDEKFWLAIAFFAFVAMMVKYVWPFLARKIAENSQQIAADLLRAKEAKEKAEEFLVATKNKHDEVIAKSKKLLEDAENEAEKLLESSKNKIAKEVDLKMAALKERVKSEEEKLLREIKQKVILQAFSEIEANLQGAKQDKVVKGAIENVSKLIH